MPANRLRFVWPALCLLLVGGLVYSTIYWQKKLRAATAQAAKKAKPKAIFDKRDTAYLRALAATLGYEKEPPLKPEDATRLSAYDRIELNKYWALANGGEPATFLTRHFEPTQRSKPSLGPTMQATLDAPFTQLRYEITNKSERTLPAPILFGVDRWDSPEALVAQAGFKNIADEVERAVAIWRFVCAHRVFGDPPTEGKEEHDVLKFLGIYGYGFCDDTARAVAMLAELSGLKGRVWALEGHIVSEVMAGGRWRMLDADQQAYFHKRGAPTEIFGVEELAADRANFDALLSFRGVGDYPRKYMDCFLTRENNKIDEGGTAEHRLQPTLRGGERMTFTNYNWGRYFLGKYPAPPPRFFNGCFTYFFHPRDLVAVSGKMNSEAIEGGHRLTNQGSETAAARLDFAYPFPTVGGVIQGTLTTTAGKASARLEDPEHDRVIYPDLGGNLRISLDRFIGVLANTPTYRYTLLFILEPGASVEVRGLQFESDFQHSALPLVPLKPGVNEFRAHFPEGSDAASFELEIATK